MFFPWRIRFVRRARGDTQTVINGLFGHAVEGAEERAARAARATAEFDGPEYRRLLLELN